MERELTPEKKEQALATLEALVSTEAITQSRGKKIRSLLEHSTYAGVYADYFLAPDPNAFRLELPHNRRYQSDALDLGLDLDILLKGIPDEGITLPVPSDPAALGFAKLNQYALECCRLIETVHNYLTRIYFGGDEEAITFKKNEELYQSFYYMQLLGEPLETIEDLLDPSHDQYADAVSFIQNIARPNHIDQTTIDNLLTVAKTFLQRAVFDPSPPSELAAKSKSLNAEFYDALIRNPLKAAFGSFSPVFESYLRGEKPDLQTLLTERSSPAKKLTHTRQLLLDTHKQLVALTRAIERGDYGPQGETTPGGFLRDYELKNLKEHVNEFNPVMSSKVTKAKTLHYFLRVEPLPPEDVDFGNNSGCCIAVPDFHPDDALDTPDAVPFYQLDLGTHVLGVYQQIRGRNPQRVGMILAFSTYDTNFNPVLLANSGELSEAMNPLDNEGLNKLSEYMVQYLTAYAEASGFTRSAMGNHNYNTSTNHTPQTWMVQPDPDDRLTKIPESKLDFYSEVLDGKHTKAKHWSWLNVPRA